MTDENLTPQEAITLENSNESGLLASRWDRLGASLIDTVLIMCIALPLLYFTGGFDGISHGVRPSIGYDLVMGAVGIIVFIILHGKLLISNGQTIGKKIVGIKIVDLNGNLPTLKEHLLKRYAFFFIPGQIPFVGQLVSTVNILFIFRKDKRCIHDLVAGTKVVNC